LRLFQRGQRSLFGEILDWMLTPFLLLVPMSIGLTWLVAQSIAAGPFDRALESNALTLARLVTLEQRNLRFHLPQPMLDMLRMDETDHVYYQVMAANSQLLGGQADLPPPPAGEILAPGEVQVRDDKIHGMRIRVAWTQVRFTTPEGALLTVQVQVAETREKQQAFATEIIKGVLLPQFAILPLAVLLIWLALVRGIKPLSELEDRIRERRPDDLSPLDESTVPAEVTPLVMSINSLLAKLKESLATQKRFLADAAHQLKTPLAGLRMQADLAQREGANAEELKQSLKQIGRSSMRATHTVNQLLALARAEGGSVLAKQPCNLARLTIEVVREAVPRAIDKRIDLGYDGAEPGSPGVLLDGNPTLLKELIRNLLDNAINYTPSWPERPGVITARVTADRARQLLMLQIEDNGPGIPEAERELIFEPFYRVLGNEADGSGLGLPIVLEIARQHGTSVQHEDAHPGQQPPGSRFTVRFQPMAAA